jgi:hypothetical protein
MQQEVNGYIRDAMNQANTAIKNDQPAGTVTSTVLQTYNQAVRAALQTFSTAINNAAQTTISGGTTLDSSAVSTAVTNLGQSFTSAIAGLGLSSDFDPTATVGATLTALQSGLLGIAAPTAGNTASARAFLRSISSTIGQNMGQINKAVATSVQGDNNSLL